ncbi:CinA family protein [Helicobacter sp. 13S00477-4]|uniref:CinA family protein n=1 Tax=Helicobacter sp. 13S00477-4 TaxID=1905759 RepID=UPI000BA5BF4D|nr:CinA family protein [Helicobacter sp. 13S00477-4]PAF50642.1 hypothetical protein BKH44_07280 [Helicobacter sp. 13S00477-4]
MQIHVLGIENEDILRLCKPFLREYDVSMCIEDGKIYLKGDEAHKAYEAIKSTFGDKVILGSLARTLIDILKKNNKKIATAESCTGGLLGYQFTSIQGASNVYDGGLISYANHIKQNFLSVKAHWLRKYGAVSEIVVREMLKGTLKTFGTDYALATSGIAGPDGGSVQKPVGTVYIGVQKRNTLPIVEKYLFKGDREDIQKKACLKALELLARNL